MKPPKISPVARLTVFAPFRILPVAASFGLALTASGADFTWNGGGSDDLFSNPDNWEGGAPVSANSTGLLFDGTVRPGPEVDGDSPFILNTLTFAGSAGSFTVGGGDFQFGGASAAIVQNSSFNQSIGSRIRLADSNLSISGTGSGTLTLGEIRNVTSGRMVTLHRNTTITSLTAEEGASLVNLTLSSSNDTTVTIGSMTAGSGGYGTLTAVGAANGVLNRLNVTTSGNYGFASMTTDSVTFGGAANVVWSVGSPGWVFNGNAGKTATFVDAGTKQFDSALYLSNNTTNSRQITFSVSGGDVTLNGRIRDSASGSGSGANGLVKTGTGALVLSNGAANSDFTGAVAINNGTVVVAANNALGSATGSTTVASGAALAFKGGIDYSTAEGVTAAGTGVSGSGVLINLSGSNQFAGAITLTAASTFGAQSGVLVLNGAVTGGRNLTTVGSGTIALANAGNAFGTISINAGTLESRAQGAIGSTAPTIGAGGTLLLSTADQSLTYGNSTFAASTSTINVAGGRSAVFSNSSVHSAIGFTKAGQGTLEMDGNRGFYGGGTGAGQAVRINEGTLVANRSGGQLIAGTSASDATSLVIGDGVHTAVFQNKSTAGFQISAFSGVTINANATLDLNGVNGTLSRLTLNGGAITTSSGILTLDGTASVTGATASTISGKLRLQAGKTSGFDVSSQSTVSIAAAVDNITSPVTLLKEGDGSLELKAANSYTGTTLVKAGTLLVNNASGSATGASTVTIEAGATLGGTGRIGGATTINGILAPGNSIGKLTIGSDVIWNAGDDWKFELGTSAASLQDARDGFSTQDQLEIAGSGSFLKGTGSDWSFDFQESASEGWYKLVTWSGSTTFNSDDFAAPLNLGAGMTGYFLIDQPSSALYLQVIPEPSTITLSLAGLAGLLVYTRRRLGRSSTK